MQQHVCLLCFYGDEKGGSYCRCPGNIICLAKWIMLKPNLDLACKCRILSLREYRWAQGSEMVQNKMLTSCTVGVMLQVLTALLRNHSARESLDSNGIRALPQIQQKQRFWKNRIIIQRYNSAQKCCNSCDHKQQFYRISGHLGVGITQHFHYDYIGSTLH